jgi:hypothetical protein
MEQNCSPHSSWEAERPRKRKYPEQDIPFKDIPQTIPFLQSSPFFYSFHHLSIICSIMNPSKDYYIDLVIVLHVLITSSKPQL